MLSMTDGDGEALLMTYIPTGRIGLERSFFVLGHSLTLSKTDRLSSTVN